MSNYETRLYHPHTIKKLSIDYIEHCEQIVYTQFSFVTKYSKNWPFVYLVIVSLIKVLQPQSSLHPNINAINAVDFNVDLIKMNKKYKSKT